MTGVHSMQLSPRVPVRSFRRRLELDEDAFDLFCRLTEDGQADGASFFETERQRTASLVLAAALTFEVRGELVTLRAAYPAAHSVLHAMMAHLPGGRLDGSTLTYVRPFSDSQGHHDAEERERLRAPSCLDILRGLQHVLAGPDAPTLFGTFSYDLLDAFEALPPLQASRNVADIVLRVPSVVIEYRARARQATVVTYGFGGQARDTDALGRLEHTLQQLAEPRPTATSDISPFRSLAPTEEVDSDLSDEEYEDIVRESQELIRRGEVFQIVPSRTFHTPCSSPRNAFARLRHAEQAPYRFFFNLPDGVLFGASPEASFTTTSRRLRVTPLAGTRRRGESADEDDRLQAELILDEKERAEHMMLVDLARNDVARISRPQTRRVTRLLEVERYARVMHLVSEVEGQIDERLDELDGLRTCLHAGTLVGAPKVRAAEHLRRLERSPRGLYGGAVGRLCANGDIDIAIVIRSAFVRDGHAEVRAGAGIVLGSQPAAEAAETKVKASTVLRAIADARRYAGADEVI